ncbi:MAG: hypothetical protein H0U89_10265 [Acidimicrobiia bacterium]|nr:hypothetical protein [Acidimicrobiia bacterium]
MRAAGTDVQWVLNAAGSSYTSGGFEAAWPGDDAVDIVSLDLFQNEAFASTTDFSAAGGALQWLEAVGAARGKLIAVDETSVSFRVRNARQVGGQDNDLWFRSLRAWSDRVVDDGQLHHVLAFEADPSPTDLFAPVFPRHPAVSTFPEARQDLIDSFGGPRPPEP